MKKLLVALSCTLGVVACGEKRQADDPSTMQTTSVTTETSSSPSPATGSTAPGATSRTTAPPPGPTISPTEGRDVTQPRPDPLTGSTGADPTMGSGSTTGTGTPSGTTGTGAATPPDPSIAPGAGATTGTSGSSKVTPGEQGGGSDREITAAIRRAVVADKALSFTAKNVKIVTTKGKVTLRGAVKSDEEKAGIEAKAKSAPGVTEVDNQLEVKK